MTIESTLAKATNCKQKKGEDRQAYLERLVHAVLELPDDGWAALDAASQNWANAAIKAVDAGKAIAEIDAKPAKANGKAKAEATETDDDDDAEEGAADDDDADDEPDDEPAPKAKPKGKATKAKPVADDDGDGDDDAADDDAETIKVPRLKKPQGARAKEKAAKAEAKAKAKPAKKEKPAAGRKVGAKYTILKTLTKHPEYDADRLADICIDKGFEITPLAVRQIRSDFLSVVRVLQEAGIAKEVKL